MISELAPVFPSPGIGLQGIVAVVKCNPGTDDIKDRDALVHDGRFQEFIHMLDITGEGSGDKFGAAD